MSGALITFEGVEGSGKSTQLALLHDYLTGKGHDVVVTREPGGTEIGAAIRGILLDCANAHLGRAAELLLYAADRAQHVHEIIGPALERGSIVLCDRFADSTLAYQGAGRNFPEGILTQLHEIAANSLQPDLTFLFDLPVEIGLARARGRGRSDRIEQESLDFHGRVREAFLDAAAKAPGRLRIMDAGQDIDVISAEVNACIDAWFLKRKANPTV